MEVYIIGKLLKIFNNMLKGLCFFLLFLFIFNKVTFSQSIVYKEDAQKANKINDVVPEGKAMLVFEANFDLEIESSMEFLQKPIRDGNLYKIIISERSCLITIENSKTGSKENLAFGQLSPNSLPVLQNGVIKYFIVNMEKKLYCDEIKESGVDNQMLYEKEALLIFNIDPLDLDLEFSSTVKITEIKKESNRYKLYIKPENQIIKIIHKESGAYSSININNLNVKEVHYYFVRLPYNLRKTETKVLDNSIATGSYIIETKPPGATVEIFGNPAFNKEMNKTPYTLNGYESGKKIITLNLNEYEKVVDTISIGTGKINKSVYELVPEFTYLKFNITPSPPYSKIFIDGKEELYISQNTDIKVPKGDKSVEVKAENYYTENLIINTIAGMSQTVNINLKPITGQLMINATENSSEADVYISNSKLNIKDKHIGKIPFNKPLNLQQGDYILKINKDGYASSEIEYLIKIIENKITNLSPKMASSIAVEITTTPPGATIFIDDIVVGRSRLKTKIGIGSHTIKIEKDNYETKSEKLLISENNKSNIFPYILVPKLISVTFHAKPSGVYVNGDGLSFNIPYKTFSKSLPFGTYKVTYSKLGFYDKNKTININENGDVFHVKLFPSSFWQLGFSYGLDMIYINLNAQSVKHLWFGASIGGNLKHHNFTNPINVTNASIDDISSYINVGKIDYTDTIGGGWCYNFKLGWFFQKPFYFIINVGYAGMRSRYYQNVYQAKHNYISTSSNTTIHTGDYFTSSQVFMKGYNSLTFGVYIPLSRKFYIGTDYYLKSETGKGFVYTAGLMFPFNFK